MKQYLNTPWLQGTLLVVSTLLTCCVGWLGLWIWIVSGLPGQDSNLEYNSSLIEEALTIAKHQPAGPFLAHRVSDGLEKSRIAAELREDTHCWRHLQTRMLTSTYELRAVHNPGQERDVDDSTVQVLFADGSVAEFVFYQYTTLGCSLRGL